MDQLPPSVTPSQENRRTKFQEEMTEATPIKPSSQDRYPVPKRPNTFETSKEANTASKNLHAIHDKVWLGVFLVHTLAYLGFSAYINYVTVANDKQSITEVTSLGPIDMYVHGQRKLLMPVTS
jgi:hypothetical protein